MNTKNKHLVIVSYAGFLQTVVRIFESAADAELWLERVGKLNDKSVNIRKA